MVLEEKLKNEVTAMNMSVSRIALFRIKLISVILFFLFIFLFGSNIAPLEYKYYVDGVSAILGMSTLFGFCLCAFGIYTDGSGALRIRKKTLLSKYISSESRDMLEQNEMPIFDLMYGRPLFLINLTTGAFLVMGILSFVSMSLEGNVARGLLMFGITVAIILYIHFMFLWFMNFKIWKRESWQSRPLYGLFGVLALFGSLAAATVAIQDDATPEILLVMGGISIFALAGFTAIKFITRLYEKKGK